MTADEPQPPQVDLTRADLIRGGLIAVAIAGVVVSMAMVVIGLPEANEIQSTLLELAMVPTSVSLAAALGLVAQRVRPAGRRSRLVLVGAGTTSLAGATLMVLAYLTGPRPLVHLGQALVFTGLLAALVVAVRLQPPRRRVWFELPPEPDDAATDEDDPSV